MMTRDQSETGKQQIDKGAALGVGCISTPKAVEEGQMEAWPANSEQDRMQFRKTGVQGHK